MTTTFDDVLLGGKVVVHVRPHQSEEAAEGKDDSLEAKPVVGGCGRLHPEELLIFFNSKFLFGVKEKEDQNIERTGLLAMRRE